MSSSATILNAQNDQANRGNSRGSADVARSPARGHVHLHSNHSHPHAAHGHGRTESDRRRAAAGSPAPLEDHRHPAETAEGTDARSAMDALETSYPQEVDHRTTA